MTIRWERGSRDESIAIAVFRLLDAGGLDSVTMRAVARTARMSVGTLGNHCGTRENVVATAAREFGHGHVNDVLSRPDLSTGAPQLSDFLSCAEAELVEQKVWYDLVTAGRSMTLVGEVTAAVDDRFLDLISYTLRDPRTRERPDHDVLDRFWVMLQGIRIEQVRPGTTLSFSAAVAMGRSLQTASASVTHGGVTR